MDKHDLENVKPLSLSSSVQKIWFTSDLHFGHRNVIRFCERPFSSVEEMDNTLIDNWNNTVGENDLIFDLGDFCFAQGNKWKKYIRSLKGKHVLILGNHDISKWPGSDVMSLFHMVRNQLELNIDGKHVYLNHYPFLCYAGTYRTPSNSVYELFGHVHSNGKSSNGKDKDRLNILFPYQYDVGVDNNEYRPISWENIKSIIDMRINNFNTNKE